MEKLLSLSAEAKILLPDFRCWALKDVDYWGNVFPDPTNPCVNELLFLKVNCNSVSSHSDDSQTGASYSRVCPLLAQQAAQPFTSYIEYMAAPSWFLMHMSSKTIVQPVRCCSNDFKKTMTTKESSKLYFIRWIINQHYRYCSPVNLFCRKMSLSVS